VGYATQVVQSDRSIGATSEQTVGSVNFFGERVLAPHMQLCGGDGEEWLVGDESGGCRVDGRDDG